MSPPASLAICAFSQATETCDTAGHQEHDAAGAGKTTSDENARDYERTSVFPWLALELRDRRQSVFEPIDLGGGASITTLRRYRRHHRRGRRWRSCGPAASGQTGRPAGW